MSTASTVQRILVVDDDREIVRLVRAYLEKEHYQVFVAYDGQTALLMARHERPNLIVLDLMLPDRDGWDITRTIRNDSSLHSIPIIMLTARIEDSEKIIGLELGADDYVTKPFNPREMVDGCVRCCGGHRRVISWKRTPFCSADHLSWTSGDVR